MSQSKYFVYTLSRPDGRVFYVGKGGRRTRPTDHLRDARRGVDDYRCRVIRSIWNAGGQIAIAVVFWSEDELAAFTEERRLIACYGRANLANLTDGGEGAAGAVRSAEWRARLSAIKKGQQPHPATIAARRGAVHSPEARAKIGAAGRGRPVSAELRAKRSASQTGRVRSAETRARMSAAQQGNARGLGLKRSPESRERYRQAALVREAARRAAREATTA